MRGMTLDWERIRLEQSKRAAAIVAELAGLADPACARCRRSICSHELVISLALGLLKSPECASCLAAGLRQDRDAFLEQQLAFMKERECWSKGWRWASEREGEAEAIRPRCLFDYRAESSRPANILYGQGFS